MSDTTSVVDENVLQVTGNDDVHEERSKNLTGISISQGLTVLKEVWNAGNRFAQLQQEYAGRKIPVEKIFGALLGFGDKPNPMALVEQQLAEINAKLDRVLAGIREIQTGLLGLGVLAVYIDIGDSVYLIEKYSESLSFYLSNDPSISEADRKDFIDKILGAKTERDSVAFCVQKMTKLGPTQTPLLFDFLFPYIAVDATPENAYDKFMKGAFAFRFMTDTLVKGLILEVYAVSNSGDPSKMSSRVDNVIKRYQSIMKAMVYNSFLPFAETLATLRFTEEYLGGHSLMEDANIPKDNWQEPQVSILRTADELAGKLMGKNKMITLRVIPNFPPIDKVVAASKPSQAASAGTYTWEFREKSPNVDRTKAALLTTMQGSNPSMFIFKLPDGKGDVRPAPPALVTVPYPEKAKLPPVFPRPVLTFLRYQFDFTAQPDRMPCSLFVGNADLMMRELPCLRVQWQKIYTEDGRRFGQETNAFNSCMSETQQSEFELPQDGFLSPVLITYLYKQLGRTPKNRYTA